MAMAKADARVNVFKELGEMFMINFHSVLLCGCVAAVTGMNIHHPTGFLKYRLVSVSITNGYGAEAVANV